MEIGIHRKPCYLRSFFANCGLNQVLRWSALGLGVFYGFYHQRSLSSAQKVAQEHREYEHQKALINQAKEAFAKSKLPASSTSGGSKQQTPPSTVAAGWDDWLLARGTREELVTESSRCVLDEEQG